MVLPNGSRTAVRLTLSHFSPLTDPCLAMNRLTSSERVTVCNGEERQLDKLPKGLLRGENPFCNDFMRNGPAESWNNEAVLEDEVMESFEAIVT